MQTSQATDLIAGGVKINALPEKVYAVIVGPPPSFLIWFAPSSRRQTLKACFFWVSELWRDARSGDLHSPDVPA